MRVLHVNSQRGWRGGECQADLLMRGLAAAADDVAAVGRPNTPWVTRCRAAGFETFENNLRSNPVTLFRLVGLLRAWRPQIVHCHDAGSIFSASLAARFCPRRERPRIVAARRVDFPIRSRFKYTRLTDHIIAVSRAVEAVLLHQGLPAEQISVVHDGIDPARFAALPDRLAARQTLALPRLAPLTPVGLCAAALTDHKDHATLLHAWRAVVAVRPDAQLLLAGQGEEEPRLRALVAELDLAEQVQFLGWRDDIPRLMAAADVALLTSHHEGLGSTLMDAQFCGLPVVATRAGGIPEIVADQETGLLAAPKAPHEIASATLTLFADPALRARMAHAGRARAQQEFVFQRMVRETQAVYARLGVAAASHPPHPTHPTHPSHPSHTAASGATLKLDAVQALQASPPTRS